MIRVASIELVTRPLRARDARRAYPRERRSLVLTLEGGFAGEAAPLPGYSPDSLEDCHAALAALPPLGGDLAEALAVIPATLPAARFALETALLARAGGLTLPTHPITICRLVVDTDDVAATEGAEALKVKIGVPGDLALVAALRARHPTTPIRLDANGGAVDPAFLAFAPELVEEPATPLPGIPVALDESLQRMTDADIRGAAGKVQALCLKPMTLGGALRCLALARLAAELGLAVYASHLHDGPIARAATRALAHALPGKVLACGV